MGALVLRAALCLALAGPSACGRFGFDPDASGDGGLGGDGSPSTGPFNVVFATVDTFLPSNLGGPAGGDQACMESATKSGLDGTYVAWLSGPGELALDRLSGARGWVRADGRPVADTAQDLLDGRIFHPIALDAAGDPLEPRALVMTMTNADGSYSEANCADYTSSVDELWSGGVAEATTFSWNAVSAASCQIEGHIYCFGIDRNNSLSITPAEGRLAFLSAAPWLPGGGIESADALCKTEASRNDVKAFLATASESAASRFTTTGRPWVRADGVALADDAEGVAKGLTVTSNSVTASGDYLGNLWVWTGAVVPTSLGSSTSTCGGSWTDEGATASIGLASYAGEWSFFATVTPVDCTLADRHIYCLEE